LADRVYLVLQPLGGDEIQFMKAGIMEVPHAFVLNKSDEPSAERSYHTLRATLSLARLDDGHSVPIHRTSARSGTGIDAFTADLLAHIEQNPGVPMERREPYFFERWIAGEWGRWGMRVLHELYGGSRRLLEESRGYDRAQVAFVARMA